MVFYDNKKGMIMLKKRNFLGTVIVYEGESYRFVYGFWEWHEELNGWLCNGELYGNNQCELIYK